MYIQTNKIFFVLQDMFSPLFQSVYCQSQHWSISTRYCHTVQHQPALAHVIVKVNIAKLFLSPSQYKLSFWDFYARVRSFSQSLSGCVQTDICLAFSLMFAEGPPGPPGHSRGGPAHPLPPGCAHHPWCGAGPQVLQPSPPASGWGAAACEWWWECGGRGERWSKGAEGASGPRLPPILHTRAAHSTHPS